MSSLMEKCAEMEAREHQAKNPPLTILQVPVDQLKPVVSDGSTASYYELPPGATELQDLIGYRNMNAQLGEIFRACYRYGMVAHSPRERDLKKIIFYAQAELDRLKKYS